MPFYHSKTYTVKAWIPEKPPARIMTKDAALFFLKPIFQKFDEHIEHLVVLILDRTNKLIAHKDVAHGKHDVAHTTPREVIFAAAQFWGAAIIVAHNHPTGRGRRTTADRKFESTLRRAARAVDLHVHDHIIITAPWPSRSTTRDWSDRETQRLRDLIRLKKPTKTMARILERSKADIEARAAELEWLLPGQKIYK